MQIHNFLLIHLGKFAKMLDWIKIISTKYFKYSNDMKVCQILFTIFSIYLADTMSIKKITKVIMNFFAYPLCLFE